MGVKLKAFLRALNPSVKLVLLFALSLLSFSLGARAVGVFVVVLLFVSLAAQMPFEKILKAQRLTVMYFVFLYALGVLERLKNLASSSVVPTIDVFYPDDATIRICLQIANAIQCALLLYHTTTQLEIRRGISAIEYAIKKRFCKGNVNLNFSHSLSLMLTFIPQILSTWAELNKAWKARGGKNGVNKVLKLLPILISLSMHKAYQTALAVMNR